MKLSSKDNIGWTVPSIIAIVFGTIQTLATIYPNLIKEKMPQIISTFLFYGFTICVVWAIVQYVNTRFKTLKKELSKTQKLLIEYIDLQREDSAHADEVYKNMTQSFSISLCEELGKSQIFITPPKSFEKMTEQEVGLHAILKDDNTKRLKKIKRLLEKNI